MVFTFALEDGVIFDGRAMMVLLAGTFGGPVAGVLSFLVVAGARVTLGGAGMFVGVVSTAMAAVLGLAAHGWARRTRSTWTFPRLFVLGAITYVIVPAWFPLIPGITAETVLLVSRSMFLVFVPGVVLGGMLLQDARHRLAAETELDVLSSAVAHSDDPMFWVDASGRITWSNPSATALPPADGQEWTTMFHPDERARIEQAVESLEEGTATNLNARFLSADAAVGEASLSIVKVRPSHAPEPVWCFTLRDVSEMAATRAMLERALESKDSFLASVSHEIRTPVTELYGFAEAIAHDPHGITEDERQEFLLRIAAAGVTVSEVLDNLLVAAKMSTGAIHAVAVPIDLGEVVRDTLLRHPEWEISFDAPEHPSIAIGDPARVQQVLRNLVTNAFRHGGNRSGIKVITAEGGGPGLRVWDDGEGIPNTLGESPFDLYATTGTTTGTVPALGVGLWVSRHLAELMGGALAYRRADGMTVFELTLPRS